MKLKRVKGTKDILPGEVERWRFLEEKIKGVMARYNYGEIRTPIFELTELFAKGTGKDTDIVTKEMYTFRDKGGRSLTLCPEGTPPVVRAYLENNLDRRSPLVKLFYIAPMFRQENPQAGRLRQFYQFGVEAIGSPWPQMDVEVISLCVDIYQEVGLKGLKLRLNSIGCRDCRASYKEKLKSYLADKGDGLCEDCRVRSTRNPLRCFDCKQEGCQLVIQGAPSILDELCQRCRGHFQAVKDGLKDLGMPFEVDPGLVRGLDYYTRTVFEVLGPGLGAQDALCGGGRYDDLVEELGGEPTPAVGFAAGMERLLLSLNEGEKVPHLRPDIFLVSLGLQAQTVCLGLIRRLRKMGLGCEMDFLGRSLKSQLREANRQEASFVLIIGERELESGMANLKDMESGQEMKVNWENIQGIYSQIRGKDASG